MPKRFHIPSIVFVALVLPLFSSCLSVKNEPLPDPSVLFGKGALRTERNKPGFAAVTPGKAVGASFGAIGGAIAGAAMVKSGNEIINENGVEDPAAWISKELMSAMQRKYGVRPQGMRKVDVNKPDEIAKACSGADYALDVRTVNWSLAYFPVNWGTYRVMYSAQLRLIDCKTGEVVAEGSYARFPEKSDDSPDWDELVEKNNAARLKKEIKIGAQEALHHFKTNILKLKP